MPSEALFSEHPKKERWRGVRTPKKLLPALLSGVILLRLLPVSAHALRSSVTQYSEDTHTTVTFQLSESNEGDSDFRKDFLPVNTQDIPVETTPAPTIDYSTQTPREYPNVPLYFQTDYPSVLYGNSTVAEGGCGITSLAMVATYLTGYEYLPDELAGYFGGRAENNIVRLEVGAEALGLSYTKPENWHKTREELRQGKIAILLMNAQSVFTESQHFIVVTEITEDGKYMVNDPYEPNYEAADTKEGLLTGFDEYDMYTGYSGAWVFDKATVPDDIARYFEAPPATEDPRYPDITLSLAQKQLLARMVWVEARGESEEGQQAVAEVVLNRIASQSFPDTLQEVVYQADQFRSVPYLINARPSQTQYQAVERAIYGPYVLPENVTYFGTEQKNDNLWGSIGNHIFCCES